MTLHPLLLSQTAAAGTPTALVAASLPVNSFRVQKKAGNATATFLGVTGSGKQPFSLENGPIVFEPVGAGPDRRASHRYELAEFFILTATNGDGVDILAVTG